MDQDPARCSAACPVCGAGTSAGTGESTPQHQAEGSREMCSGAGQPAV